MSGSALFVGAHPDDIEIGCGGTVARLHALGWHVVMLVLTDETRHGLKEIRRQEATDAARCLGIPAKNVLFGGLEDGELVENASQVTKVRELVGATKNGFDVVFVHSPSDKHNDHRACCGIVRAAFRDTLVLGYFVPNSMNESSFAPRVYVQTLDHQEAKCSGLNQHQSQVDLGRIQWSRIEEVGREFGRRSGLGVAEAMEILDLPTSTRAMAVLNSLNDAPFSRVWNSIAGDKRICVIMPAEQINQVRKTKLKEFKASQGLELLRQAFLTEWPGGLPLYEVSSEEDNAGESVAAARVLINGGAVSNAVSRDYFNHFAVVRYRIEYTMPNFEDVWIADRLRGKAIRPLYAPAAGGFRILKKDFGILSIIPNPVVAHGIIVGCMGVHGLGTKGCFLALTDPTLLSQIYTLFVSSSETRTVGFGQLIVEIDAESEQAQIKNGTFHAIPA